MAETLFYLGEVSLCVNTLYLIYVIFFRNTTFFRVNRWYLLTSLVISFVIPLLEFSFENTPHPMLSYSVLQEKTLLAEDAHNYWIESETTSASSFSIAGGMLLCYFLVVFFLVMRMAFSVKGIIKLRATARPQFEYGFRIFRARTTLPFTFYNMIFLPETMDDPMVIEHEKVHIIQRHWIDLILIEISRIILWFNPVMIFFGRSLKLQHEYLADAGTLNGRHSLENYLTCLLQQVRYKTKPAGPISLFFSNTIKKRILMMTKDQTPRIFSMVYLLVIPVVALLLTAFSNTEPGTAGTRSSETFIVIVDPAHGGTDNGATAADGMLEKELTLTLGKHIKAMAEKRGIQVILTREEDVNLSLQERTLFSKNHDAALFLSLHLDFDPANESRTGVSCIITANEHYEKSKMLSEEFIKEMDAINTIKVNGVRQGNPFVLKNNTIPALILELGYLSNNQDRAFMSTSANQNLVAEKIINAMLNYKKKS